jgi:hypothetical protein
MHSLHSVSGKKMGFIMMATDLSATQLSRILQAAAPLPDETVPLGEASDIQLMLQF